MIITEGYGVHKYYDTKSFMYQLSDESCKKVVTKFSAAPLTKRVQRRQKRLFRQFILSGLPPHEHKMFQCKGCSKCK